MNNQPPDTPAADRMCPTHTFVRWDNCETCNEAARATPYRPAAETLYELAAVAQFLETQDLPKTAAEVNKAATLLSSQAATIAKLERALDDERMNSVKLCSQCNIMDAEIAQLQRDLDEARQALRACDEAMAWELGGEPLPTLMIEARAVARAALERKS